MKRAAALTALSREHHGALVLAKRIAGADAAGRSALGRELAARFTAELEPHFLMEEAELLPRLARAGALDLVERTLEEHRLLRALVLRTAGGDQAALTEFGRLLEAHVRFEERELFAAAQSRLDAAWLATKPSLIS